MDLGIVDYTILFTLLVVCVYVIMQLNKSIKSKKERWMKMVEEQDKNQKESQELIKPGEGIVYNEDGTIKLQMGRVKRWILKKEMNKMKKKYDKIDERVAGDYSIVEGEAKTRKSVEEAVLQLSHIFTYEMDNGDVLENDNIKNLTGEQLMEAFRDLMEAAMRLIRNNFKDGVV